MKKRMKFLMLAAALTGAALSAQALEEITFSPARVATTFVSAAQSGTARDAIKAGLERHGGALDIAISDFTDLPLQFVLIRLSSERQIRLLLGRGGAQPDVETEVCQTLNDLFAVRFTEELGHRFAVVGGQAVVLSTVDWTQEALGGESQVVVEIEGEEVAGAFSQQFEALWAQGSTKCSDGLNLP